MVRERSVIAGASTRAFSRIKPHTHSTSSDLAFAAGHAQFGGGASVATMPGGSSNRATDESSSHVGAPMKHPTPPARGASTQRAAARATVSARLAIAPPSSPLRGARVSQWSRSSAVSAVASRWSSVLRHAREYQTTAPPGRLTPSPPRISLLHRAGDRVPRAAGVGRRRGGCDAAVPRRSAPRRARRLRRGSSRALERRRRGRRQPSPPESASAPAAGSPPRRRRRHAVGGAEGELVGVP